jgi:hypothetical protein
MTIIEYFYNDDNRRLYVEFSTKEDEDKYYRVLELNFDEIEFYSPDIIDESDMMDIDEEFIIELLNQYFGENDLPEEKTL